MAINADKPTLWKADIAQSVDLFNRWFLKFAPKTFREQRLKTTEVVEETLQLTRDFSAISVEFLQAHPARLMTLRMATCPPLARDRLIGLADVRKSIVGALEKGTLPRDRGDGVLVRELNSILNIVKQMLDQDIFPWLEAGRRATKTERYQGGHDCRGPIVRRRSQRHRVLRTKASAVKCLKGLS
ncbi:MAG: XamI family restriction endonuclease [Pirellulales bacterium]